MERGHTIRVLDDGFVKLVDWMGGDEDVVAAARVSTGRGFVSWEPYMRCKACAQVWLSSKTNRPVCLNDIGGLGLQCDSTSFELFPRGDLGILEYLYKNHHTSPLEMCSVKIHVRVPMDAWRQWIRHRTAKVNEYSTRYSEAIDSAARTSPEKWRLQGTTNRQGSGSYLGTSGEHLSVREREFQRLARELYEERLAFGVAKEQARKDLPLSTYTEAFWKNDLHNTLHFLRLRLHPHAQEEIRAYASAVAEVLKALWPRTYALFEEYDLYGVHLSRSEAQAVLRNRVDEKLTAKLMAAEGKKDA